MARAQSQYLRLYDAAGVTYHRWQQFHVGATVTWDGQPWLYQPFEAEGIVSGDGGDEGGLAVTLPATSVVISAVTRALREAWLAELRLYQFDALLGETVPGADQQLVAQFNGELVSAAGPLTSITLQLGSSLAPVGAQLPPRTLTTRMIGKGCQL